MLNIKNLSVSSGSKTILQDINLKINEGEIHVLMGSNGSGKSSLVQFLAGNPEYGLANKKAEVIFAKNNLVDKTPDEKAKLGLFLAFQNPIIFDGISVFDLLKLIDRNLNKQITPLFEFRKQIEEYCQLIGFDTKFLQKDLAHNFSGGERKRIEFLQLMVAKPKLALIDEIDSGLDAKGVEKIAKYLKQRVERSEMSILLITHNKKILEYLSPQKYYFLEKGKIIKSGGKEIFKND